MGRSLDSNGGFRRYVWWRRCSYRPNHPGKGTDGEGNDGGLWDLWVIQLAAVVLTRLAMIVAVAWLKAARAVTARCLDITGEAGFTTLAEVTAAYVRQAMAGLQMNRLGGGAFDSNGTDNGKGTVAARAQTAIAVGGIAGFWG